MTRCVYIEIMSAKRAGTSAGNSPSSSPGNTPGNTVRRYRRLADITQAQLAAEVEVSRQTIVSIEGGDYSPSVYLALRIAGVLSTTVETLFGTGDRASETVSP